jgi:hypothetical protein
MVRDRFTRLQEVLQWCEAKLHGRNNKSKLNNKHIETMKKIMLVCAATLTFAAMTACKSGTTTDNNSGWVDLGLPSGLLWATCNVGADTPEEFGDYFAWGETQPKDEYTWDNYRFGSDQMHLTKYCSQQEYGLDGFTDLLTTLKSEDDAAASLGDGARTPTREEWQELMDNTTSEWTTQNGVKGIKFTASNGNAIFLPAAECKPHCHDNTGYYWSSSLIPDESFGPYLFAFSENGKEINDNFFRCCGFTIRAVRLPK